jgi:colanic acid biosynthesis glycosyl transferase WcaI
MRILIVSQYFWPENFRINDLAVELINRNHDVTVLTGHPNYPSGNIYNNFLADPSRYSNFNGAKVFRVPMLPRGKGKAQLILNYLSFAISASVFGIWKLRRKKIDVIFTFQTSPITVGIPAVILRFFKQAPLVFWVLDLWPESIKAAGGIHSKWILSMVGRLVSFIYKHCDLILVQSKSFIPEVFKYSLNKNNIKYFPSWSDNPISKKKVVFAKEIKKKTNTFNVMFAGNLGEAQDFPAILNAIEILKSNTRIRWLIVGDGRMKGWITKEINKRNLQKNIFLLGSYPVSRMPSFYKHADALLVSLKDEFIFSLTIPGKIQSYLASGKPILGMLNGSGAEIIRDAKAGFTCPAGESDNLAKIVLKMYSLSSKERLELGKNGIVFGESEFNRDVLIDKLEFFFDNVSLKNF